MTAAESASQRRELVKVRYEIQKDELAVFFTKWDGIRHKKFAKSAADF
jgi:hypothetical protein